MFLIYFVSTVTKSVHHTVKSLEEPKPTTKPAKSKIKPAEPTEPDFFGDKYTTDDLPPSVSILAFFVGVCSTPLAVDVYALENWWKN